MKYPFILLFFLVPITTLAQLNLDLQQCREMALESSTQIEIAKQTKQKASYETRKYRSGYLPRLSAVGYGLYNQKKYDYSLKGGYLPSYKPGADGKLEPDLMIDPTTNKPVMGADGNPLFNSYAFLPDIQLEMSLRGVYSIGAQLEQAVYMGGKVRAAHQMAKLGERISVENVRYNRSEILYETEQAYWQLLEVGEQVLAAQKYEEVVRELVKDLENSKEVGIATSNDVLKAQVRYNEASLIHQKARNGKVLASMNLCRCIGLDLRTELHLQDSLLDLINPQIWSLDSAVSQRPDYKMLEGEMDVKAHQVALSRSDFLPQIGVTAGYAYSGGVKLNGDDQRGASFSAMASVKIPVFNWGEGRNSVRSARMEEEISRLNLEKSTDLMILEIASTRFKIQDAQARVKMNSKALEQAHENVKISTDQYQVGLENLTALLEAQAQWQEAWSQWINAKASLQLSASAYLKAIGQL